MARDRNDSKTIIFNDSTIYEDIMKERNVPFIEHYRSYSMVSPSVRQMAELQIDKHVWSTGDKYWKLAEHSYGDPSFWWVIAWFNKKPTESHMNNGDLVLIPRPLENILDLFNV